MHPLRSQPPAQALVGLGRFELPTSRLSGVRSNQLSYRPDYSPNPCDALERETKTAAPRQSIVPMKSRYGDLPEGRAMRADP